MKGHVYQRTPGSWSIRYDLPTDSTGKRKQKNETFKGITKRQAERKLRERLGTLDNGTYVPVDRQTVTQYLQEWLATYAATKELSTQEGYRGNITRYIIPAIGWVELQKLTPQQVQGIYTGMLARGLSPRTVLHTHRVLREALGHAVIWGKLVRNVADATFPPQAKRKPVEIWDPQTLDRFLEAADDSRFYPLYLLDAYTGLRRSEICGLQWPNVDLAQGQLAVVGKLQRINGKGLVHGDLPKSSTSRRTVPFRSEAVDVLLDVRDYQTQQLAVSPQTRYGPWQYTGYLFTQEDGTPVDPESVTREFAQIVRKARLPYLTFHGLRHVYASLMLYAGVSLYEVSKALGHSSIAITADIYGHLVPGMQETSAQALADLLARARQARLTRRGDEAVA